MRRSSVQDTFFSLLTQLHPAKQIEWNYNEAHHGKGPMDGIGGTIKNKVFQEVKSGRIVVTIPEDFARHARKLIESVTTLYLPTKEILPEPASVSDAPYIKGTLDVHRIIRRKNIQGVMYLEFYRLSSDEVPFFTQYYRNDDDPIVCGHQSFNDGPNKCASCFSIYHQGEEWMECPVCMQ